jgi:hypothetical protein
MKLVAVDVALLPPPDVADMAIRLSASLPDRADRLRLDTGHLPHITLTQLFVRQPELDEAFQRIGDLLRDVAPLQLHVPGGGKGSNAVWIAIDPSPVLVGLHERLMETLRGFERPGGGPGAFFGHDARPGDVLWVTGYRLKSAFAAFTPHITLGHAPAPPRIDPFDFTASVVAACHLGRFCSCRRVLRQWDL